MVEINETSYLLREAANEIRSLRRVNEILQAKVGMIELFDRVLRSEPPTITQGYGEDIAWKMDRHADMLLVSVPIAPEKTDG